MVAPRLEPHQRWAEPTGEVYAPITQSIDLSPYFAAGSWELDVSSVKVVQMRFGYLVFRDIQRQEGNRLIAQPVSVVVQLKQDPNDSTSAIDALVLEAPEGAVLNFDGDRSRPGSIGAPSSGNLVGPITIRQAGDESDGPLLRCATRNVQITHERVWTPNDVEFQWGRSHGKGRELSILLQQETRDPSSGAADFAGIRSMTVRRVEHLAIDLAHSPWGGRLAADPALAGMLQLSCQGPFQLDLRRNVALFEQQVMVRYIRPEMPSDTLTCQFLELHFRHARDNKPVRLPDSDATGDSNHDGGPSLQLVRIQAAGSLVQLTSPERLLDARGELFRFDVETRRFLLDGQQVGFQFGAHHVRASRLEYQLHPESERRLGRLWAHGPGRLDSQLNDKLPPLCARWNEVLQLQPYQGQHVLSLTNGASLEVVGLGGFTSRELHLYLREEPLPVDPSKVAAADQANSSEVAKADQRNAPPAMQVLPDRMLARGEVRLQSEPVEGGVDELQVWFRHPRSAESSQSAAVKQPPRNPTSMPWESWRGPPMQLRGTLAQVQVRTLSDNQMTMEQASISGKVSLSRAESGGNSSWSMQGDRLEHHNTQGSLAMLVGQPARMESAQAVLEASSISADSLNNRIHVHGPGRLRMANAVADAPPTEIVWKQGVEFDSLTATFMEQVEVRGEHRQDEGRVLKFFGRADSLSATLNQPLTMSFQNDDVRPKLELAAMTLTSDASRPGQEVHFECTSHEKGHQVSFDRIWLRSLAINRSDGEIVGQGPGRAISTRAGGVTMPSMDGALQKLRASSSSSADDPTAQGLTFLEIRHQGDLGGNLHSGYLRVTQDVRATMAPVKQWDQEVRVVDRKMLTDDMAQLLCNQLTVAQAAISSEGERQLHLQAEGNAQVLGRRFFAQAERLSFDQRKDMLVLEGGAREPALLEMHRDPNAPPQSLRAGRFIYWPRTMDFRMENGQGFFSGPLTADPGR